MRRLPLAVLVACCLTFVACSPGEQEAESSTDSAVAEDDLASNRGTVITDADDRPAELAMTTEALRLGLERPDSYLPTEVSLTDQSAVIISDLLYDGLTEAVGTAHRLRPGVAEGWWHDDDYTTWTFSLDPARGVSAESVVTSLSRFSAAADRDEAAPVGVAARLAAGIQEVTVVDHRTVVVQLDRPNAGLPWILSGLRFSIVGPEGEATGGYRIVSDDAAGLRLAPRRDEPAGGGRAVRIEWIADRSEGYQKLLDGKLHGSLVPDEAADEAANGSGFGPGPSVSTRFYVLHLGSDAFADPAIRERTRSAIDRQTLVAETFSQQVVPVDGLLPPTMAGYRPDSCPICRGVDEQLTNGVDPGLLEPLEVAYSGAEQQATAAAIVAQLEASGIPAREQPMEPEELASVIVAGGTDIFSFGWVAAATSSDAVLPVLLAADSPANVARIGSPEIERILAAAAVTADDEARWDLHHQAHQAALSSGRLIPVAAVRTALAVAEDAGVAAIRADGSIDLGGQ